MDWLKYAAIPGAVLATVGLWGALGFPTVATSGDIRRLDRQQAATAVEIYQSKTRNIILNAPAASATAQTHRLYEEELRQAREQLKAAEDRRIELAR